jgi:hypothetical protein
MCQCGVLRCRSSPAQTSQVPVNAGKHVALSPPISSTRAGACWPREELLRQAGRPHRLPGPCGLLRPRQGRAHWPDRPHLHTGACRLCMASEWPTCARRPHAHGTGCAPAQVACREAATVPQSAFLIDLSQISSMLRNSTPRCPRSPTLCQTHAKHSQLLPLPRHQPVQQLARDVAGLCASSTSSARARWPRTASACCARRCSTSRTSARCRPRSSPALTSAR